MSEVTVVHRGNGSSAAAAAGWLVFIVIGWLVFAYLAFGTPGGLSAAWAAVHDRSLYVQIIIWLLFLPWMVSLWIANSSMALWLRAVLILMIFVVTFALSVPSLLERLRSSP